MDRECIWPNEVIVSAEELHSLWFYRPIIEYLSTSTFGVSCLTSDDVWEDLKRQWWEGDSKNDEDRCNIQLLLNFW